MSRTQIEIAIRSVSHMRPARHMSCVRLSMKLKTAVALTTILCIGIKSIKMSGNVQQKRKTQIDRRGHGCTLTPINCTLTHISHFDADWPLERPLT